MPFQHICGQCKNEFPSSIRNVKYCSRKCHNASMTKPKKTCAYCKQPFKTRHPDAQYCSRACSGAAHTRNPRVQRPCGVCGKIYTATSSRSRFCGVVCQHASRRKYDMNRNCKQCGAPFVARVPEQVCCSQKCAGKAKTKWGGERICPVCQKVFVRYGQDKIHCSQKCGAIANSANTREVAIRTLQQMSGKSTSIERETYAALESLGLEFEPQHRIGYKVVDAFIASLNTIIECQGDYFHCNPAKYPNGPTNQMQTKNVTEDKRRFSTFKTQGYTVIALWEKDIKEKGALNLLKTLLASP